MPDAAFRYDEQTDAARMVLEKSVFYTQACNHEFRQVIHLVAAGLAGSDVGIDTLKQFQISTEHVKDFLIDQIVKVYARNEHYIKRPKDSVLFRKVLDRSRKIATDEGDELVSSRHLLLAAIASADRDDIDVLEKVGLPIDKALKHIREVKAN